jgi:hypothetical protein
LLLHNAQRASAFVLLEVVSRIVGAHLGEPGCMREYLRREQFLGSENNCNLVDQPYLLSLAATLLVSWPSLASLYLVECRSMCGCTGNGSFAAMLDRAILRSREPPRAIEHRADETVEPIAWTGPMPRSEG